MHRVNSVSLNQIIRSPAEQYKTALKNTKLLNLLAENGFAVVAHTNHSLFYIVKHDLLNKPKNTHSTRIYSQKRKMAFLLKFSEINNNHAEMLLQFAGGRIPTKRGT
jgi:hypothetical protein